MPRRRVDRLEGLRIEFNQTERDALEMWAAGSAAGDVLSGVGRMLAPFEGAITALVVAYIAEKGIDSFLSTSANLSRVYNKSKTKVDALVEQCQKENPGMSQQDCYSSLMDRELSLWEKIVLRGAGYTW